MNSYRILEGEHSSGFHFKPLFFIKELRAKVRFHESCLYNHAAEYGVNKLFGFSQGLNHMKNSKRWGWTSDGKKILLHLFDHIDGKIFSEEVDWVKPGEWRELALTSPKKTAVGYRLYPYFGGILPAPHDMDIDIEWGN